MGTDLNWGLLYFGWIIWMALPIFYTAGRGMWDEVTGKADAPRGNARWNAYLWLCFFWIGGFLPLFVLNETNFAPEYGLGWLLAYSLIGAPIFWRLRKRRLL